MFILFSIFFEQFIINFTRLMTIWFAIKNNYIICFERERKEKKSRIKNRVVNNMQKRNDGVCVGYIASCMASLCNNLCCVLTFEFEEMKLKKKKKNRVFGLRCRFAHVTYPHFTFQSLCFVCFMSESVFFVLQIIIQCNYDLKAWSQVNRNEISNHKPLLITIHALIYAQ